MVVPASLAMKAPKKQRGLFRMLSKRLSKRKNKNPKVQDSPSVASTCSDTKASTPPPSPSKETKIADLVLVNVVEPPMTKSKVDVVSAPTAMDTKDTTKKSVIEKSVIPLIDNVATSWNAQQVNAKSVGGEVFAVLSFILLLLLLLKLQAERDFQILPFDR